MSKNKNDALSPETLALSLGYDPKLSEGSVKPPVFLTSTFQFNSAEEGKRHFEIAYGLREREEGERDGLIYSRINNPNAQIFEERMASWDGAEKSAVFSSGMAAISTLMMSLAKPGDVILFAGPVYGGTYYLFEKILPQFNIKCVQIAGGDQASSALEEALKVHENVKAVYAESPANPSNLLIDLSDFSNILSKQKEKPVLVVDNTFLGPVFQKPLDFGADVVVYSATKFIGGHSDLIAGVLSGSKELVDSVVGMRSILGNTCSPFVSWLLLRSLETLSIRMKAQAETAKELAMFLSKQEMVTGVAYPGNVSSSKGQSKIYNKHCSGAGSLISFEIKGGEAEAFKVLNAFKVAKLAVSLGGTESLVQHPYSMTHADVPKEVKERIGISESLIRMSVGLENVEDLKNDLKQSLSYIA